MLELIFDTWDKISEVYWHMPVIGQDIYVESRYFAGYEIKTPRVFFHDNPIEYRMFRRDDGGIGWKPNA